MCPLPDLSELGLPFLAMGDGPLMWICIGVAIWLFSAAMSKEGRSCRKSASNNARQQSQSTWVTGPTGYRRCRHCQVAHPKVASFCRQCGQSL